MINNGAPIAVQFLNWKEPLSPSISLSWEYRNNRCSLGGYYRRYFGSVVYVGIMGKRKEGFNRAFNIIYI